MPSPESSLHTNDEGPEQPTVGQPLNAPERRPLGKVLVLTLLVFAVIVLGYLAAVQWLIPAK